MYVRVLTAAKCFPQWGNAAETKVAYQFQSKLFNKIHCVTETI